MNTCATCRYNDGVWFHDDYDDVDILLCSIPEAKLPLCMRGVAMREKQPVRADATGCPMWEIAT
jgi:hypothetical protein